jgi:antibiotic biosynthesis monooxygenase (ABM) superfamily enzyme
VYAVEGERILRPISSEAVAADLYGSDWNKQIDDISDAFYGNYQFGIEIDQAGDYDKTSQMSQFDTIDDLY